MTDMKDEQIWLLVKISQLYFENGLNQQEIAERLGISRSQVSRALTAAKAQGIVTISIKNPYSEEQYIERELVETFGIHDARVVRSEGPDQGQLLRQLGISCGSLLESVLKDSDIVGVMSGRTVAAVSTQTEYFGRNGLQFVPLVGGWGSAGASWLANSNTMAFAETMKSKYWLLHAPAVVATETTRDLLMKEPEIAHVIDIARRCTVAVIGIGEVSEEATIVQSGYFGRTDLDDVTDRGAVGNLCTSFIDIHGKLLDFHARNRMLGVSVSDLTGKTNVIGVAYGREKVPAITATLRGRWVDILVTDVSTAKLVLDFHKENPLKRR